MVIKPDVFTVPIGCRSLVIEPESFTEAIGYRTSAIKPESFTVAIGFRTSAAGSGAVLAYGTKTPIANQAVLEKPLDEV